MATGVLDTQGTRAAPPPFSVDPTVLGLSDPVWLAFGQLCDLTAVFSLASLMITKREVRHPSSPAATGPSEVSMLPRMLDATEDREDGMSRLEIAAQMGDEAGFVQAATEIDWLQRSAGDFARATRLALAAGAHLLARNLASRGARLHPDAPELQKMARVLAPPRVLKADLLPDPSAEANRAWLRAHAGQFKGQWVALRNGVLLASAGTAKELRAHLDATNGVLMTRVF